jgi:Ca-activated chloride channel family protein
VGSVGHPEWGPFGSKDQPNYSTSWLHFTIAEYYAATGKRSGLTVEDLARPEAVEFARNVESAVVHYGDITMTFLNNWFRNDARGTSLTYVSAVAVEEKSVIDYNKGNPDGVISTGEEPREPRVPLIAVYPKEGTLYSDNPFIVLDASWVDEQEKEAARNFEAFVKTPEAQQRLDACIAGVHRRVAIRHAHDRLVEIAVAEADGAQHRAVGRAGDALRDQPGATVVRHGELRR